MEGKSGFTAPAMTVRLVALATTVGLVGAYPTWWYWGGEGLMAELVAGLIVLAVMIANILWVMRQIPSGPAKAALTAAYSGMLRAVAVLGFWALAWQVLKLQPVMTIIWVAVFYFPLLAAESLWLSKALRARF